MKTSKKSYLGCLKCALLVNSALNSSPSFSRSSTAQAKFVPLAAALRRPLQAESWPCCVSPSHTHPAWSSLWILAPSSPVTAWTCASPTARAGETEKCNRSRPLTSPRGWEAEEYHCTVAWKQGGKGTSELPVFFSHTVSRVAELVGYKPDDLIGRSGFEFLHALDSDHINKSLHTCECQCVSACHNSVIISIIFTAYLGLNGFHIRIKAKSSINTLSSIWPSGVVRTPSVHLGL